MAGSVIHLESLTKKFRETTAVDAVSLRIEPGAIFGFLGANGAGKTTTIRMLCGLTRPTSGTGRLFGLDAWTDREQIRQRFGYVPQRFSLYSDLTVWENLRFFGGAYRVGRTALRARIDQILEEFDLTGRRQVRAGSLSGGYKQLLSIACGLLHRPSLLFLDEPTAGLDPVHRQSIWELLYQLSRDGTTIFVTSHYMDEVERCSEVGFIREGRLLTQDTPARLKRRLDGKVVELLVEPASEALQRVRREPGIWAAELRANRLRILADDPQAKLDGWIRNWPYPDLKLLGHQWVDADMEDVFISYSLGHFSNETGKTKAAS